MAKAGVGLRATIILTITVVMFLTMLLIGFVVLTFAKKNIYDQKMHSGEIALNAVQYIVLSSIRGDDRNRSLSENSESLQHIIDHYVPDLGLNNLTIVDISRTILAQKWRKTVGQKSIDDDLQRAISTGNTIKNFRPSYGKNHLCISSPLSQNGKIIGALQAVIPLDDVEESMADFQRTVVFFTITTSFIFIIIGSLLLTRYLVKPLERVIKATEDITEGFFSPDLEPTGRNEIGTLSASLSRMADKLREDRNRIEHYVQSLEETNRQLKRAQDEVLRSEKLASVGKLAAGVAHEIGNPIGIILGYIDILRSDMNSQEEKYDTLKRVENEIMRIDKIIRELLCFSRPRNISLHPLDVNTLIEETTSLISHQKSFHSIELELGLQEGIPLITGDEQQFQQVIINLLINAINAMPRGGKLTIHTESYSDAEDPSHTSPGHSGVKITIKDTGVGISKKHISEIFDPFFTTQDPGKGTGLGLSVSLRIIESFGGTISVESSPGEGAEFSIKIPAHSSLVPERKDMFSPNPNIEAKHLT